MIHPGPKNLGEFASLPSGHIPTNVPRDMSPMTPHPIKMTVKINQLTKRDKTKVPYDEKIPIKTSPMAFVARRYLSENE